MKNKFSERIANLRRKKGWSQKETALKLGISQALLSHYEKGIRECGLDFLIKAADVFGCSTDYLLGISDTESEIVLKDTDSITADLKDYPELLKGREDTLNVYSLLYSITARIGNPEICEDFNKFILSEVYCLSRLLEKRFFNSKIFKSDSSVSLASAKATGAQAFSEMISKMEHDGINVNLGGQRLKEEYPSCFRSLSGVIETFEKL